MSCGFYKQHQPVAGVHIIPEQLSPLTKKKLQSPGFAFLWNIAHEVNPETYFWREKQTQQLFKPLVNIYDDISGASQSKEFRKTYN